MAFPKTTIYLSFALLAAAALLSSSSASAHSSVNPFCSNADDHDLCAALAGGSHTWAEAMTRTLGAVMERVKAGKAIAYGVESKLPADFRPQTKESIAATCRMAYDNILDNIQQCIGFVRSDPYSSLDTYLSATTFSDCTDGLQEFRVNLPEVEELDREILKLSSVLLAVAQLKKPAAA